MADLYVVFRHAGDELHAEPMVATDDEAQAYVLAQHYIDEAARRHEPCTVTVDLPR